MYFFLLLNKKCNFILTDKLHTEKHQIFPSKLKVQVITHLITSSSRRRKILISS